MYERVGVVVVEFEREKQKGNVRPIGTTGMVRGGSRYKIGGEKLLR